MVAAKKTLVVGAVGSEIVEGSACTAGFIAGYQYGLGGGGVRVTSKVPLGLPLRVKRTLPGTAGWGRWDGSMT